MNHTRPWSDDPIKTLENKFQLAIDLSYCCEKIVYQLAIVRDNLPETAGEISDSAAETIQEATNFIMAIGKQMLPGSLLYDSLIWFCAHALSDDEKQVWNSFGRISNLPLSEFKDEIAMQVDNMREMAKALARFRDEFELIIASREAGNSPNELRFSVVEKGAMLYGVFVPVTTLLLTLLRKLHDIERECTYEKIASWHPTWKDKYENREGDAAERDISKRIGEPTSRKIRVFP